MKLLRFNAQRHQKIIDENGSYGVVNSKYIATRGIVGITSKDQLCPLFDEDLLMISNDGANLIALAPIAFSSNRKMIGTHSISAQGFSGLKMKILSLT